MDLTLTSVRCPECNESMTLEDDGRLHCPTGCWPLGIDLWSLQELEEEKAEMWNKFGDPA